MCSTIKLKHALNGLLLDERTGKQLNMLNNAFVWKMCAFAGIFVCFFFLLSVNSLPDSQRPMNFAFFVI